MRNESASAWRDSLRERKAELQRELGSALMREALDMVDDMKAAIGEAGPLADSIKLLTAATGYAAVRIVAGGTTTTKTVAHPGFGKAERYDYSNAEEFGTRHEPARPFFWSTIRKRKNQREAAIRATLQEVFAS